MCCARQWSPRPRSCAGYHAIDQTLIDKGYAMRRGNWSDGGITRVGKVCRLWQAVAQEELKNLRIGARVEC